MAIITIVYHSGYGHTKRQAEAVLRGLSSVSGVTAKILTTDEATANLDSLDASDGIIFGCPTYMGSMSAEMKKFIEAAAKKWFTLAWKDKIAGAFTNSGSTSGDKLNTMTGLMINAMQHGMIYVGLGMHPAQVSDIRGPGPEALNRNGGFAGPMASSFQVNDPTSPSTGDIATAEAYGKRIAEITLQYVHGKK
jgi:NAD(P)H dehydrogenase (quinone)